MQFWDVFCFTILPNPIVFRYSVYVLKSANLITDWLQGVCNSQFCLIWFPTVGKNRWSFSDNLFYVYQKNTCLSFRISYNEKLAWIPKISVRGLKALAALYHLWFFCFRKRISSIFTYLSDLLILLSYVHILYSYNCSNELLFHRLNRIISSHFNEW